MRLASNVRRRPLHVLACLALGATTTLVATSPARADGDSRAANALAHLPAPNWRHYVQGTSHREVSPVRVVSTVGDVTNPKGLLGALDTEAAAAAERLRPPRCDMVVGFLTTYLASSPA